jgi:LAO/AO transport system kinase
LKALYKNTGKGYVVGITGPPGAGKSTITNGLIKILRAKGFKIELLPSTQQALLLAVLCLVTE